MRQSTSAAEPPRKKRRRAESEREEADLNSNEGDEEGPACQSCRKRKAKCSRQQPCSHCERLEVECIYDERRMRPGMKTGAIEALNQRLSNLEQMFIGQGMLLRPLLAQALEDAPTIQVDSGKPASLDQQADQLKQHLLEASATLQHPSEPPPKLNKAHDNHEGSEDLVGSPPMLPEAEVDALVHWYFENVHRWIPVLHAHHFQERLHDPAQRRGLNTILHAITSLCLRFSSGSSLSPAEKKSASRRCRHAVILQSMERFSVGNLQALVIVAFDIIGSGRGPSAWSVVGSMTRTVEHLRLSTEASNDASNEESAEYLIRRMSFLRKAESWTEEEERRRVFWCVFIMDRFCSVATGWNNSLTGADVRRRLPCEGAIWKAGTPVKTPFFGIAERPSHAPQTLTLASERHPADDEEMEAIGGFAFCVEATESLNLVTKFFLQYAINIKDPQEVQMWLMRFKELDLRLVKWRIFLPPKWHNASVLNQDGIMDPNLTLAHILHNTAVVQLHQCVAFPSAQWRTCPVSLPSASSAETCVSAACEISTIAQQFLQQSAGITNPQLSFCLFIAGRVLLAHLKFGGGSLHPAFDTISASLAEIARRWSGPYNPDSSSAPERNLASRLSKRLVESRLIMSEPGGKCGNSPTLDISQPVYSNGGDAGRASQAASPGAHHAPEHCGQPNHQRPEARVDDNGTHTEHSPESISMAFPPLPLSFEPFAEPLASHHAPDSSSFGHDTRYPDPALSHDYGDGSFDGLSGMFDHHYQQMLRVSTYTDTNQEYGDLGL